MSDAPKGIKNPWRVDPPLTTKPRPPRPARADRIDPGDALDADLAIPSSHTIRAGVASIKVTHVRVTSPRDALDVLAECVYDLGRDRTLGLALETAGVGVECRGGVRNAHVPDGIPSSLTGTSAKLIFRGVPLDVGFVRLAKLLGDPRARAVVARWGVTPMLTM